MGNGSYTEAPRDADPAEVVARLRRVADRMDTPEDLGGVLDLADKIERACSDAAGRHAAFMFESSIRTGGYGSNLCHEYCADARGEF